PTQHPLPPIQTGLLEFPGMAIGTQGVLRDQVQVVGDKVEYLRIPEPAGRLSVDFERCGLEEKQMAAIFQGRHVGVKRLPGVTHERHPTGSCKLPWDAAPVQGWGLGLPSERLSFFRLA